MQRKPILKIRVPAGTYYSLGNSSFLISSLRLVRANIMVEKERLEAFYHAFLFPWYQAYPDSTFETARL